MRYTYQQLETIRERARALGLAAEFDARASDPDEPFLAVRMPEASDSLSYFTDLGRLSSIQAWGDVSAAAAEVDKLHAALTADLVEPPPSARCGRCGVEIEGSGVCAKCDAELANYWAGVEVPL